LPKYQAVFSIYNAFVNTVFNIDTAMLSDWMNTLMHYNRFQSSQIVLYQLMPSFCNFHHEYMGFNLEKIFWLPCYHNLLFFDKPFS